MIIELDDDEAMELLLALREAEQQCYNEPQLRRLRSLRDRIRTARELPGERVGTPVLEEIGKLWLLLTPAERQRFRQNDGWTGNCQ